MKQDLPITFDFPDLTELLLTGRGVFKSYTTNAQLEEGRKVLQVGNPTSRSAVMAAMSLVPDYPVALPSRFLSWGANPVSRLMVGGAIIPYSSLSPPSVVHVAKSLPLEEEFLFNVNIEQQTMLIRTVSSYWVVECPVANNRAYPDFSSVPPLSQCKFGLGPASAQLVGLNDMDEAWQGVTYVDPTSVYYAGDQIQNSGYNLDIIGPDQESSELFSNLYLSSQPLYLGETLITFGEGGSNDITSPIYLRLPATRFPYGLLREKIRNSNTALGILNESGLSERFAAAQEVEAVGVYGVAICVLAARKLPESISLLDAASHAGELWNPDNII